MPTHPIFNKKSNVAGTMDKNAFNILLRGRTRGAEGLIEETSFIGIICRCLGGDIGITSSSSASSTIVHRTLGLAPKSENPPFKQTDCDLL